MDQMRKVRPLFPATLRVSAIVELATGCALLAVPSVVIQGLAGSSSDQAGWIVGRPPSPDSDDLRELLDER